MTIEDGCKLIIIVCVLQLNLTTHVNQFVAQADELRLLNTDVKMFFLDK